MKRREFITLLGGAAAAWPFAAQAQPKPVAQLGVLLYSDPQSDPQMASIRHGLSDLGWVSRDEISLSNIAMRKVGWTGFRAWRPS